jgi:hypothetical protein
MTERPPEYVTPGIIFCVKGYPGRPFAPPFFADDDGTRLPVLNPEQNAQNTDYSKMMYVAF